MRCKKRSDMSKLSFLLKHLGFFLDFIALEPYICCVAPTTEMPLNAITSVLYALEIFRLFIQDITNLYAESKARFLKSK